MTDGCQELMLVVDDSAVVRRSTAMLIEAIGYKSVEAENGKQALDRIKENPLISFVITDFDMPEMDGKKLIECIYGSMPIVLMSAHVAKDIIKEYRCVFFLPKPFSVEELKAAILSARNLFQGKFN